MPAVKKASDEKNYTPAIISNSVKSYAKHPYFVKKAEEAKQTINKTGLPIGKKK